MITAQTKQQEHARHIEERAMDSTTMKLKPWSSSSIYQRLCKPKEMKLY